MLTTCPTTEQDALIRQLADQNATVNERTRLGLLLVCFLVMLAYVPTLFRARTRFASLLSLTSLGATAWTLHSLPPGVTGIAPLDAWIARANEDGGGATGHSGPRYGLLMRQQRGGKAPPLERYLPYLNVGLCVFTAVLGVVVVRGGDNDGGGGGFACGPIGMGYLPAGVYAMVVLAKTLMGSVDPERELTALKYDYKGA
jgi:hypothetical protein